jgi:transcriptional regulator with XRE-family HTH domain
MTKVPRAFGVRQSPLTQPEHKTEISLALRLVFATNLKRLRSERGLSQSNLALRARLNRSYLSRLENGKNDPRLEIVGKLAKVLGVTPAQLLTREQAPQSKGRHL